MLSLFSFWSLLLTLLDAITSFKWKNSNFIHCRYNILRHAVLTVRQISVSHTMEEDSHFIKIIFF